MRVGDRSWYGNCIWDAMGIPALLRRDATIEVSCGCCGTAMHVTVVNGSLEGPPASPILRYRHPAGGTTSSSTERRCCSSGQRSTSRIGARTGNLPRGEILSLDKCWRLAKAWYGPDRREPGWRRRNAEKTKALFAELGLTSPFWRPPG